MSIGEFAGNFLTAFQNAKNQKSLREQDEKEKKARLSLFEIQLEREKAAQAAGQQQSEAQKQLFERLQTPTQVGPPGNLVAPPGKPPSLTELLADPQGAALLLRSGVLKGDDILKLDAQRSNRSLLEQVLGVSPGGGAGGGVSPGGRGLELSGLKIGPEGQIMPDFGLPQVSVQTIQTPQGPKIVSFNPRNGQQVAELGAPQESSVSPGDAARLSNLQQGEDLARNIKTAIVNPDGSVNRGAVFSAFGLDGGLPFTGGRNIASQFESITDVILRSRSGAGLSKGDVESIVRQYTPRPLDSDATIKSKLDRLEQTIAGNLDVASLPKSLREKVERSRKRSGDASPGGGREINFEDLP